MSSLLLDCTTWDLCADAYGNIAAADAPYTLAQEAATAIRLFRGEAWYDTGQGVPYWEAVLGRAPSAELIRAYLTNAALSVPGVVTARVFLSGYQARRLSGQVQITDASGVTSVAGF